MKPCRDCGVPAAPSARSCPSCGILNPVLQWVALPDGEHLTRREAVAGGAPALAMPARRAPKFMAPASRGAADVFGQDPLASWAIWMAVFVLLSLTLIGGAVGGVIAAAISLPIGAVLPTRPDGRKLPVPVSIALIVVANVVFWGSVLLVRAPAP